MDLAACVSDCDRSLRACYLVLSFWDRISCKLHRLVAVLQPDSHPSAHFVGNGRDFVAWLDRHLDGANRLREVRMLAQTIGNFGAAVLGSLWSLDDHFDVRLGTTG